MALQGEYRHSARKFVADHVQKYEETGDPYSGPFEGQPTVILTTKGRKTGYLRKVPLVRVEHDGQYAVIASIGGADKHPEWYLNLRENPDVVLQDGPRVMNMVARTAEGAERAEWWAYATQVWPDYDEYQTRTERVIPVVRFDPQPDRP